jgi:signal recognition particle subunit SRP68
MDVTSPDTPPNIVITPTELSTLFNLLHAEVNRFRGLVELHNLTEASEKKNGAGQWRPLVERLHEYSGTIDTTSLVVYPPKVDVAPVKPLFFDAAWNYIDYDRVNGVEKKSAPVEQKSKPKSAVEEKQERSASPAPAQQEQPQKRGWFGFGR